jgi:hypothetical protein
MLRILGDSISEVAVTSRDAEEKYQANKEALNQALGKTWGKA